jgi:hypothetical protein
MEMSTFTARRLVLATGAGVAVVACGAVVAVAVAPEGGAVLTGTTSHLYEGHPTGIRLKVSDSGERVARFDFPACASENKGAVIKRIKIAADGSFSGKRSYRRVIEGGRSGGGSDWDVVYDWKARVKGRFTAPTKASGTLSESYRAFLRDTRTGEIRDEPGTDKYWYCKTGKTTWKAKSPT